MLKMGYSWPLFSSIFAFSNFNTVGNQQILFTDDWIRIAVLWSWMQRLYQLTHSHCPLYLFLSILIHNKTHLSR